MHSHVAALEESSLGAEICRRRSSLMMFPLTVILGMLLIVIGCGALWSNQHPLAFPAAYKNVTAGICLPTGAGLVVLALWLRPVICFRERGLEVLRRFGPAKSLPYDQVESIITWRSHGSNHGVYTGTLLQLYIKAMKGSRVKLVQISHTHKEPFKGGGLLNPRRERVEQPEDRIAAAIATYMAPRFMERLNRGEDIKFGSTCSISRAGINTRQRGVTTFTSWSDVCGPYRADDESLHAVRNEGRTLPLLNVATIPNLVVLALLVEALATGELEAEDAAQ